MKDAPSNFDPGGIVELVEAVVGLFVVWAFVELVEAVVGLFDGSVFVEIVEAVVGLFGGSVFVEIVEAMVGLFGGSVFVEFEELVLTEVVIGELVVELESFVILKVNLLYCSLTNASFGAKNIITTVKTRSNFILLIPAT